MAAVFDYTIQSDTWDVRFDEGRNHRAKIGFVLIPNEQTIEDDMVKHAPQGVGMYFSRALMPKEISTESLAQLGSSLAETAGRILPDDKLDVISFACTSGTVAVGEEKSEAELNKGASGAKATTLMGAVRKALNAVGASRLAVGTPYADELNTNVATYILNAGFELANFQGMNLNYDNEMIRVAPEYLVEFAQAIDRPDADAILISCGALRTIDVVEDIERLVGKPVICSNQAMLWDCLRLANVNDPLENLGRLFREN
ncbi:MAG: arylmalonate decarboxylase [Gammaproteobacteria bacterium]|nr:arylmalonate decarboxylase [Gammaproteobacteria bacterium]